MAQAPALTRSALACALGEFILDHLPYGSKVTFPPLPPASDPLPLPDTDANAAVKIPQHLYATDKVIKVSGFYPTNTAANEVRMNPFVDGTNMVAALSAQDVARLEHWTIDGVSHQITKTMRIWFTYDRPAEDGPPTTVGSWLLVGYVGNGHE